jgi:abortive infection bacteriophage resistance protein
MLEYTKAPLTYTKQVALLQSRGLTVTDAAGAVIFLQQVNYYRFSAYCIPFQNPRDVFIPGSTFEKIAELYRLDEELRNAILALLSSIEIFLRTHIVYELSHKYGAFSHYEPAHFRDANKHSEWITELEKEVIQGKETFLEHYQNKYKGFPKLPLWIACEVMTMGSLSYFYSNLLTNIQQQLCSALYIRSDVMRSWMNVIRYLRNVCAHHSRIWNRELANRPVLPCKDKQWSTLGLNNSRLFACIILTEWICRKALIPVTGVEQVHDVMRRISTIDERFSAMMGVPLGRAIGMCWETK